MNKITKTIFVILLALGMMGIILGITVGLYRNDILAGMHAGEDSNKSLNEQLPVEQFQSNDPNNAGVQNQDDRLLELLLWGNLHTAFLGVGILLTIVSLLVFLLGLRKSMHEML